MEEINEQYMRRAIALAMRGRGGVEPNPMVGCVIVKEGRVIGEGYHQHFGGAHAEVNALGACRESPAGGTAYVTLEPCCHTNKKTPPCAPRLIEAGIGRVVVGCLDANPAVNGGGIAALREAGVRVEVPVLENSARQLIAPYLARVVEGRPYITLKWAQSADGKVGGTDGQRLWISNAASTRLVHELRERSDAILVGIGTVLSDNPLLTVRLRDRPARRQPRRVVIDGRLRMPAESRLVRSMEEATAPPLLVVCTAGAYESAPKERIEGLRKAGVEILPLPADGEGHVSLDQLFTGGYLAGTHLLVEPGPRLARGMIEGNWVDRLWVIRSQMVVGEDSAPTAAEIPGNFIQTARRDVSGDTLCEYVNPASRCFFSAEASADVELIGNDGIGLS